MADFPTIISIKKPLQVLCWAAFWFLLINVAIFCLFDRDYLAQTSFQRSLMNPSDNEIQRVITAINADTDHKHVVILGNSVAWGVGVDDASLTFAGRLSDDYKSKDIRVVNLSVPGESLLDQMAIARSLTNENDAIVVTANPTIIEDLEKLPTFSEHVHFPELVKTRLSDQSQQISSCCGITIPELRSPQRIARSILFDALPIYRNRDSITKKIIGLQPSVAVNAVLHRVIAFRPDLFSRETMGFGVPKTFPKPVVPMPIADTNALKMFQLFATDLAERQNVYFVLIDDNRYDHGPQEDRNINQLFEAFPVSHRLNLYGQIDSTFFYDTVHLSKEGHALVAKRISSFLKATYAP